MATALQKFHRASGLIIAIFLLLHFTNHLFALAGPQVHIRVMEIFRELYRFPPVEILLLACVASQIVSGATLVAKKGFRRQPVAVKVQVLSGGYLALFLINHVAAVMMARYQWHIETDFYFAANVAVEFPSKLFFIPYYTLSILSVFAHIASIHFLKRTNYPETIVDSVMMAKIKRESFTIFAFGAVITVLVMISFTGLLYKIA
ncbi:hypothetical protein [Chitinophaga rhizosphaerae]|uniref:hypothetical protein n=1 Tax=Chitinophaga rhizosphaerae TaxID=1864947 RepID=UPI000F80B123|nr:hypothetical protein [Chitinophaga rhizosphaerae]